MKLYLASAVRAASLARWGTAEAAEAERVRREVARWATRAERKRRREDGPPPPRAATAVRRRAAGATGVLVGGRGPGHVHDHVTGVPDEDGRVTLTCACGDTMEGEMC